MLDWFWDISAGRSYGFNGPNSLSMTEIANWSTMTGTIIRREEASILRQMDTAYLNAVAKEQAEAAERSRNSNGKG